MTTGARRNWAADGRFAFGAVLLLGVMLPGCAGEDRGDDTYVVTDSAGVRIVVNQAPLWGPDEGWTLSPEPVVEIGAVEGAPESQFHNIQGVARLSDGRLAVLDGGSAELRLFDASGRYLSTMAARGEGPGELDRVSGLLHRPGDTLGVAMLANWAVSWFTGDGQHLGSDRLDSARHAQVVGSLRGCPPAPPDLLPDATFLACVGEAPARPEAESAAPVVSHHLVRSPYDVSWVDTVGVMRGLAMGLAFASRGTQVAAGGEPLRLFVGDPAFFEIDVVGDRAGRVASIRYPGGLAPVGAPERARHDEHLEEWRASAPPAVVAMDAGDPVYAPNMPGFSSLHYDPAGYLWAVEYAPPWERPGAALVFAEDGPLLGRIEIPEGFQIRRIELDVVVGIWRDPMGVEFVRVYALDRG